MALIVISNAFRMSANERVAQFGTLKCVGATKEQVYKTIMYECVLLCIVAIPLGVVLGYLLSFVGIGISNQFMEEMNTLVRIMIKQVNFSLSFVFFSGSSSGICSDLWYYGLCGSYDPGKKGHESTRLLTVSETVGKSEGI